MPWKFWTIQYSFSGLLYCLLDKDVELVWEQLSVEEREEFQKMLSDGQIGHLLDSYTPWWKVSG